MTPQISPRRPLRALCALGLALISMAAAAPAAVAYVTPAQAELAAGRGAGWFLAGQQASGDLGSDWAMTALASAGLNSADARTSIADPSAQDFYLGDWQATGPGGAGTDAARGILSGVAGGIQVSRLSTSLDATKSNLVARLAELYDGTQLGDTGLLNDDIFGVLALHRAGAPQEMLLKLVEHLRTEQLPNGGWGWSTSPGAPADTDMTGSAIAAFCAAGVATSDPDLNEALDLLHTLQDPATGGFVAPPESFGIGVNTDTTAWVTSGLVQCGIDPQGPEWTTSQGKTPFDYLLSLQRPDGHFDWTADFAGGPFETFSSVRPLMGDGFSAAPPARLDGVSPAVRPVAPVATGTTVPIALVIDHGPGADDVRMCRVDVDSGSGIDQLLAAAESASSPAGCVAGFAAAAGGAGVDLASLNGVAEPADYEWRVQVDGVPQSESDEPIGFGDLVFLELAPTVGDPAAAPRVEVPPLRAKKRRGAHGPRISVQGRARWKPGVVGITLHCPRGNGPAGCRGTVTMQFRDARRELRIGGSAGFELSSGGTTPASIHARQALREAVQERNRVKLRITAVTRAEEGAIRVTRVKRFVTG